MMYQKINNKWEYDDILVWKTIGVLPKAFNTLSEKEIKRMMWYMWYVVNMIERNI